MNHKALFILILFAVLAIVSLANESFAAAKVRMGYLQSDLHQLAAFIALERGFYKEEGINVVVEGIFKAGPEEMSAFASKDLDFGYVGEAPATVAVANRVANVKIIAQVNLEGSAVVISKGLGINTIKGLKGKTVAVPGYATVQDFLLRKSLSDSHIAVKAVNMIIIKPPEMIPALRTKQIDAFIAWEPYPSKAITSGVGVVLISSGKIWPKHPCCVMVADTQFIEKNPEIINGILRAHVKATKFIHENPKEALDIGVKYTGMDRETVELAMKNIYYEYIPDVQGELDYVTFIQELGQIKNVDPSNFVRNLIQTDFLNKIIKER